eukprot:GSChrysophyteH1.ASY1.ANO1.1359.1 assembled CDS
MWLSKISESDSVFNPGEIQEALDSSSPKAVLAALASAVGALSTVSELVSFLKSKGYCESIKPEAVRLLADCIWLLGSLVSQGEGDSIKVVGATHKVEFSRISYLVNQLVISGVVDVTTFHETLDVNMLTCAGLLGSNQDEDARILKKVVKLNTNIMYRQQKYNRLEEEKEGYSKLLDIVSTLPSPPANISVEVSHILCIIGHMDLDPNRILDIILSAFEKNTWNLSYIELLSCLQYSQERMTEILGFKLSQFLGASIEEVNVETSNVSEGMEANSVTKSNEESTNEKNNFVSNSESSYVDILSHGFRETPAELYGVIALLISQGVINMDSILPYLHPTVKDSAEKNKVDFVQRVGSVRNVGAVSMGIKATEVSDTVMENFMTDNTQQISEDAKINDNPELPLFLAVEQMEDYACGNQFIGLFSALLEIRSWNHAKLLLKLLSSNGMDPMRAPGAREALQKLLIWMLSDLYEFSSNVPPLSTQQTADLPLHSLSSFTNAFKVLPPDAQGFKKFEGSDCSLLDFPKLIREYLLPFKHHLASYPILIQMLCRILKRHCSLILGSTDSTDLNDVAPKDHALFQRFQPLMELLCKVFLPSLTCGATESPTNLLSRQLWEIISMFPYPIRFEIYTQWYGAGLGKMGLPLTSHENLSLKSIECCHAEMIAIQTVRALLKRMTSDNAKTIGKKFAQFLPTCPLVVFEYLLKHICAYENLIPIAVDTMKYASELSFDCLTFSIIRKLEKSDLDRDAKLLDGETHVEQWFANLSKFIACIYRKYRETIELDCLFDYILKSCVNGGKNTIVFVLLEDILREMGGCFDMNEVSHQQLEGLCGGRHLQGEVMHINQDLKKDELKNLGESKSVLVQSLFKSKSALPFLVLVAKAKHSLLFSNSQNSFLDDTSSIQSVKMISHLHDKSQALFVQLCGFLFEDFDSTAENDMILKKVKEMLDGHIPSLSSLLDDYNLSISDVFQISRPLAQRALAHGLNYMECPEWLRQWHPFNPVNKRSIEKKFHSCYHQTAVISIDFVIIFWVFSPSDIKVPEESYEKEIRRISNKKKEIDKQAQMTKTASIAKSKRDESKRIVKVIHTLSDEVTFLRSRCKKSIELFKTLSSNFFTKDAESAYFIPDTILQNCFIERMSLSPLDALYTIQFLNLLHECEVSNFSSILFTSRLISVIPSLIYQCTEGEAACLGHAMNTILTLLSRWLKNESLYIHEAAEKHGFIYKNPVTKNCGVSNECGVEESTSNHYFKANDGLNHYSHMFYTSWCFSWHTDLINCLKGCFESNEYIHIRSSLIFLDKVLESFPIWADAGKELQLCITKLELKENDRNDLKLMSKSLSSRMAVLQKSWLDLYGNPIGAKTTKRPQPKGNITSREMNQEAREKEARQKLVAKMTKPVTSSTNFKTFQSDSRYDDTARDNKGTGTDREKAANNENKREGDQARKIEHGPLSEDYNQSTEAWRDAPEDE